MKSISKTQVYIIGVLAIVSLFVISNGMRHNSITESKNVRFNDWVRYYSRCEGYTVEQYDFETFKSESDVVKSSMPDVMASDVQDAKQLIGFVTVYYDWERDIIFFRGTGPDPAMQYCIFSIF